MSTNSTRVAYRFLTSSDFDFEVFKELDAKGMRAYADDHAKYLGKGETRIVYDLGNGTVLKIALNGDTRVNPREARISQCLHGTNVVAKVLDYDRDEGTWLVMEKAVKLKTGAYKYLLNKLLGFPGHLRLRYHYEDEALFKSIKGIMPNQWDDPDGRGSVRVQWLMDHPSQWWEDFKLAVQVCNLPIADLNWSNFGAINGNLVVLDYAN